MKIEDLLSVLWRALTAWSWYERLNDEPGYRPFEIGERENEESWGIHRNQNQVSFAQTARAARLLRMSPEEKKET